MKDRKKVKGAFERARDRMITTKVVPMPADVIVDRIISAGWLLGQMDIAGGSRASKYAGGRAVTVGLEAMEFKAPVYIGDDVTVYTEIIRQGRSSIGIKVEVFAERRNEVAPPVKVTEGTFTFVHIDEKGRPMPIDASAPASGQPGGGRRKASVTEVSDREPPLLEGRELSLRTVPFPRDRNYNGDIFGGWVLAQMDLACALRARKYTGKLAVPVAIDAMTFHKAVAELEEVSFYTDILKTGKTSVTMKVEAWSLRQDSRLYEKVTEGTFVYVAIDKDRRPVPIGPGL